MTHTYLTVYIVRDD